MVSSVVSMDRLETLAAGFDNAIVKNGFAATPAFDKYKKIQRVMPSKRVWARKITNTMRDTMNNGGTLSSGATTLTVTGNSATNPVYYFAGYTYINIESEWMKVTAVDATGTILTISRGELGSSAASHVDSQYIYITPANAIGSGKLGRDDSQFAGREYNYVQNFQMELPIANLIQEGRQPSWANVNEASFANQMQDFYIRARAVIENSFFYGRRQNQGTAAPSTASMTLTADGGSNFTGGMTYFIGQHSGRSVSASSAPPTMVDIQTDVRTIRDRGAFDSVTDTEYGPAQGILFCSLLQFDKIQQLPWPNVLVNQEDKQYGTYIRRLMIGGVTLDLMASRGVKDTDYFIVPNRPDLFEITVQRFVEKQPINPDGDQATAVFSTTWLNKVGEGFVCCNRYSLASS